MYCGTTTIAIRKGEEARIFPLTCRSWSCPSCAPKRRRKLIAEAMEGQPTRFVTLTVNPNWFGSPEERGAKIARAWRDYVRWFRLKYPKRELQYLVVLELTRLGEPHLHIVCRSGWIDQKELSKWMAKSIGAPVVDIRIVKGKKDVAKYVTKYISKRPIKLGTLKRYWRSSGYLDKAARDAKKLANRPEAVWVIDMDAKTYKALLQKLGKFIYEKHPEDCRWRMYPFEPHPPGWGELSRRVR